MNRPSVVVLSTMFAAAASVAAPTHVRVEAQAPQSIAPTFEGLERGASADETYELNMLMVLEKELVGATPNVIVVNGKTWHPERGKYLLKLTYDEFYRIVGRPDLEAQWKSSLHAGLAVVAVGGAALIIGGVLIYRGASGDGLTGAGKVGIGLALASIVTLIVGSSILRPPTDESAAVEMAVRYDEALRARLNLPPLPPPAVSVRAPRPHPIRLTLGPTFGVDRSGFGVALRY